jgi:RHS repeat-associated protein
MTDTQLPQDRYSYRAFGVATHTGTATGGGAMLPSELPFMLGSLVSSTTSGSDFTFIGRLGYVQDQETSLYFLRMRYYDPLTGRFLSEDPIGYRDPNLYLYVRNEPVNRRDPSGLAVELIDKRIRTDGKFTDLDKQQLQAPADGYSSLARAAAGIINKSQPVVQGNIKFGPLTELGKRWTGQSTDKTSLSVHWPFIFEWDVRGDKKDIEKLQVHVRESQRIDEKGQELRPAQDFRIKADNSDELVRVVEPKNAFCDYRILHIDAPGEEYANSANNEFSVEGDVSLERRGGGLVGRFFYHDIGNSTLHFTFYMKVETGQVTAMQFSGKDI